MSNADLARQTAAATAYEEYLVPALFAEWAPRVVGAASLNIGDRVLDVGCGTGVAARAASRGVGPSGFVTGLDANPGMLAVAARLAPGIEWRQGTAESLPFPDASYDAVMSQFALMFFHDREVALREMIRVLEPGGRLAVAVWDGLENNLAYAAEVALLRSAVGESAANALSAPFALGDQPILASLVASAGLSWTRITSHKGHGRFPSIRAMVEPDLCGWLPVMGVTLEPQQIQEILDEAERALVGFALADGTVAFECRAHLITGTKP